MKLKLKQETCENFNQRRIFKLYQFKFWFGRAICQNNRKQYIGVWAKNLDVEMSWNKKKLK